MSARKRAIKSDLKKVDKHEIKADEYDDAPELTDDQLARARARATKPKPK